MLLPGEAIAPGGAGARGWRSSERFHVAGTPAARCPLTLRRRAPPASSHPPLPHCRPLHTPPCPCRPCPCAQRRGNLSSGRSSGPSWWVQDGMSLGAGKAGRQVYGHLNKGVASARALPCTTGAGRVARRPFHPPTEQTRHTSPHRCCAVCTGATPQRPRRAADVSAVSAGLARLGWLWVQGSTGAVLHRTASPILGKHVRPRTTAPSFMHPHAPGPPLTRHPTLMPCRVLVAGRCCTAWWRSSSRGLQEQRPSQSRRRTEAEDTVLMCQFSCEYVNIFGLLHLQVVAMTGPATNRPPTCSGSEVRCGLRSTLARSTAQVHSMLPSCGSRDEKGAWQAFNRQGI